MFKTVIIKKQYDPPILEWEGSEEYPRNEPVQFHKNCKNFNPLEKRCVKRNVIVELDEIACKYHLNLRNMCL